MFDVKNSIDWKTAKSYYIKADYDIYYDIDNYSRLLCFESCGEDLSYYMDTLFGGDWRWIGDDDIEMLDKHYEALSRLDVLVDNIQKNNTNHNSTKTPDVYTSDEIKLGYNPAAVSFKALEDIEFTVPGITNKPESNIKLDSFSKALSRFILDFTELLISKNKAYGNSALEPINIFSKASSSDVILQQIDHKLSRLKNSNPPTKNDVIDLMGYLTLYCLDQSWLDLRDLHN